jgi:hypothetical protein
MGRLLGLGAVSVAGLTAALLVSSCGSTDVTCEDLATCPRSGQDGGGDETEAGADGQGGGGSDAADAAEVGDAGCTSTLPPSKSLCINGDIALLVSSRAGDGGTGKRGSEFKTIGAAIRAAQLGPKRIYICDDGVPYTEAIAIDAFTDPALDGISFYGGFDCADWTYSADKRARVSPPSGPALTLRKIMSGVNLADLELVSADASTTAWGTSSIAAIVDTATNVVFERVKITSGAGADGQAGADGLPGDNAQAVRPMQQGLAAMCPGSAAMQIGGYWNATTCGSKGGSGGPANQGASGYPGLAGVPGALDNSGLAGGVDGQIGADGAAGTPGVASSAIGSYTPLGYTPALPGGDGGDGAVGQGGGGGGASNATGNLCIGASGGAGGMGGCGGKKGLGGASGGASIALLSWSSIKLTLDHCDLIAGNGGGGGKGGNGGLAGSGKPGAEGGAAYTSDAGDNIAKGGHGGPGGNGGLAGSGAGGNGGPSYALVYKGDSPSKIVTTTTHGRGGTPGSGGMQVGGVKAADGTTPDPQNELQVN